MSENKVLMCKFCNTVLILKLFLLIIFNIVIKPVP